MVVRVMTRAKAAAAGRRRTHFPARSHAVIGRAWIGSFLRSRQVLCQLAGGLEAFGGLLLETFQADGLDVAGQARHQPSRRDRLGILDHFEGLHSTLAPRNGGRPVTSS